MGIEIIGKLTQKNNGDFKLVNLADVDYDGTGKSAKQELENKIEEAKNSSIPYDDSAIKADINNIKTDLGTEELTTTSKKIKGAINDLSSQIKENEKNFKEQLINKANQSDLEVERARINSFTTLAAGSTTGDAELIDARIGIDSTTYDNLGAAIRTQISTLNNRIIDLAGEEMKVVFKEKTITLPGNGTSDALLSSVTLNRKYIVLIKNGTVGNSLRLDWDSSGNGQSYFSDSFDGYAINTTENQYAKMRIYNQTDKEWTGTICMVDITDNTDLESYLIENGYDAVNYSWKGQLNEIRTQLTDVNTKIIDIDDGIRTQLTNINTRINNVVGQEIKTVFKERQLTLAGNATSSPLIEEVVVGRKYILLIKNGTEKVSLALDKDKSGNGRSIISNSHNGYAVNETTAKWARLYIYNMNNFPWTGTICLVDITDNTELEQYLIENGYDAVNDGWKGVLPELRQNLDTVYREKIKISKTDSETTILEKFKNAYNTGNCDVVFEPGTYTFSDIFNHVNEEIPIGGNCHYYFNGSTIVGTKPESISSTKNMFGSLRTGGNYELYDGILIGNSLTYIIHDEADADKEMYTRKYHNMVIQNNTGTNTNTIRKCIGAGTGCHGIVEIDSCVFLADYGVDVSYHGIDGSLDYTAEFILTVKNSYFSKGLRLDGLGKNQKGILIYSGNNMQPNEARPTGWTVYEFNNGQ